MMLSAPFSGLLSHKNADSLSVAAFESHIHQLCQMMQTLLHAGKVTFWLLHPARSEVICLQDIPHPERIGLSIPIDAVSALSDAFNHASVLEFPNAHLDARLRNTPIGHEPADIILARVVFDDDIQGMLVCSLNIPSYERGVARVLGYDLPP